MMANEIPVAIDCLVVGAGPAGASLACFLARYAGVTVMMISDAPGTADTPRAHLINPAGMECIRDLGLEDEAVRLGNHGGSVSPMRWCRSVVGEEFGRIHTWGAGPDVMGKFAGISPCESIDLPQWLLEPILVRNATLNGVKCLFNTDMESFVQLTEGGVISTVRNKITNSTFQIKSKFIFGCDGGRSIVATTAKLPFHSASPPQAAYNVLIQADLKDIKEYTKGQLHWIMNPERDTKWGPGMVFRQVRPYDQWLLVCFPKPDVQIQGFDSPGVDDELFELVKEVIGDPKIPVNILGISKWNINEVVAETYSNGDAFCVGDAVHRHPPVFGLGANTSIQDAYNLAWKVALVLQGKASLALLETYSVERQPVGATLVRQSNAYLLNHASIWEAIGMFGETVEERVKLNKELYQDSETGSARRAQLSAALERHKGEGEGIGIMFNQWYDSSAVYLDDENPRPPFDKDLIREALTSTYPGSRLPHAWLSNRNPNNPISIHDLAGQASFTLFTGHGGKLWISAAQSVSSKLGIPIKVYSIGHGLDYHDVYRDWERKREVGEDGCLLIRPDRYVAWRSQAAIADCETKLLRVLKSILSLEKDLTLPRKTSSYAAQQ